MADRLLLEFGSLPALLAGSESRQTRAACGHMAAVSAIRTFASTMTYVLRLQLDNGPVLSNWQALLDYLGADMAHRPVERFRVLYLNSRNNLICDELMSEGTIDQTALYVREVIRRALEVGAASMILAHNHPSGNLTPSRADVDMTRAIAAAAQPLAISVHDHVIVSPQGHVSLRARGLLG